MAISRQRSVLATVFVVLIVVSGIFSNQISIFYTEIFIKPIFNLFHLDYASLERSFDFLAQDDSIDFGLGKFGYFGTYLLLHIGLISSLFKRKVRTTLILLLLFLVIGSGLLTVIFKVVEFDSAGSLTFEVFDQLVGRPLILFLVEGGGWLLEYLSDKTHQ